MKNSPADRSAAADEQASLWAARLEGGTLSAADRDALDAWLAADPRHRALLSEYCQFSADLEEQLLALVASGGVELPPEKVPVPRRRVLVWAAAAVALAAAIAINFAPWAAHPGPMPTHLSTAAGQRQSMRLVDATQIELNARTSLEIDFQHADARLIRLASGEAFFSVSKDRTRPFIVETPAGSVRVTGTAFNVRTESTGDLDVTVVEGTVQVMPGEVPGGAAVPPQVLHAGDHLAVDQGVVKVAPLSASELDDALAWRRGQIVFRGTPLVRALERFAQQHGRRIAVSPGVTAAGLKIGGVKNLDRLDAFLADIRQTFPDLVVTDSASGGVQIGLRTEQP